MKFKQYPIIIFTILGILGASSMASAQVRKAGHLGVGVGSGTIATGLSFKYFPDASSAYQFNIGYHHTISRFYGDAIGLGFDYLLEQKQFVGDKRFGLAWHVGPGVSLGLSDGNNRSFWILGISGVLGLEFLFDQVPFDFVLDYRPSLFVFNNNFNRRGDDGFALDLVEFGGHIRYYF